MMTEDEILQHIAENEPSKIDKCPDCGRWMVREWELGQSKIVETYTYKHPHDHHMSFAVKSVTREEVQHG